MPIKGSTITNPTSGDVYEFIETGDDTRGERVVMKAVIHTRGILVPKHIHIYQDESFEILSGKLTILSEDKEIELSKGEKITLPKNKAHNHYNKEESPVSYIHTVSPALDFDYLIENLVGLAADGKSKNGKYGLVQELVTLRYLDGKTFLADIPMGVQKILMHTVAPIARLFGYRAIYKKYSGIEK